jgi:hypothetical protein
LAKPFRSDKRKKELLRLKKQEEKRQRRFSGKQPEGDNEINEEGALEGVEGENPETTTESQSEGSQEA